MASFSVLANLTSPYYLQRMSFSHHANAANFYTIIKDRGLLDFI